MTNFLLNASILNGKCLDIYLLCSLQIAYPFQDKSYTYTIQKMIKVMVFLRNAHLFLKKFPLHKWAIG